MIPVVDFDGFAGGSNEQRRRVAAAVDAACRTVGFLMVIGHGVTETTINAPRRAALDFFDLPVADRLIVAMPEPGYPYGYSPLQAEALNRSIGGAAPPHLKETFNVGPIGPPPRPLSDMADPDERAAYSPNLWPPAPSGLRAAVEEYYLAMAALCSTIMEAFALALGLDDTAFELFIDEHTSALRLAHYPSIELDRLGTGAVRAGAHTDYGTLTVLWTDGTPGLQVQSADGTWTDVQPVDGGLIVNVGDLMERWSNDRWRSTMHRVMPGGPGRRLSIPFFHNANWDARIECIVDDGDVPRHEPTTAGHHLMAKYRSTVT